MQIVGGETKVNMPCTSNMAYLSADLINFDYDRQMEDAHEKKNMVRAMLYCGSVMCRSFSIWYNFKIAK